MLTPFQQNLKAKIEAEGPLPLYTVMGMSNAHYYSQHQVFGKQGDFITAPEISQIFGEVIAFWVLNYCLERNLFTPAIIELGPGRGVLARDMMNIFSKVNGFKPSFYFLENSQQLRDIQSSAVSDYPFEIAWIDTLSELPSCPAIFIVNEFFDALPITQKVEDQEVKVDFQSGQFVFIPAHIDLTSIIESSPDSLTIAQQMCAHLNHHSGAALIIDYGDYSEGERKGDTLQALKNHQKVHPLAFVGDADLTAHVDFKSLAKVFLCQALQAHFMTQRDFLMAYGYEARLAKLLEKCSSEIEKQDQLSRANRLIDPAQMGTLFKVLEITS